MVARRYGIYLRVFTSISNEWAQRTSKISNVNTRRKIPYLQASMYYSVYYINFLMTAFLTIFRRFPTTFRRFPKIFHNCSEGQILTNFDKFLCPRQMFPSLRSPRNIMGNNVSETMCPSSFTRALSTIKETKLISEKLSISSLVKLS